MAAVRGAQGGAGVLAGFVLMVDNVTGEVEQEWLRDRLLHA